MKKIVDFFTKRTLSAFAIAIVSGITLLTSAGTVIKVAGSMSDFKPQIPEVKTVQTALQEEPSLKSEERAEVKTGLALNTGSTVGTTTGQPKSITQPTTTPGINAQPNSTSGCIITLFGKQYDVTALQTSHSGGNVFKCGTDQTTLYQSQHGTDLSRMQKYLVTGSVASGGLTTGTGVSSSSSSSTGSKIQMDDDVESEHEDEESERIELKNETHEESEIRTNNN